MLDSYFNNLFKFADSRYGILFIVSCFVACFVLLFYMLAQSQSIEHFDSDSIGMSMLGILICADLVAFIRNRDSVED